MTIEFVPADAEKMGEERGRTMMFMSGNEREISAFARERCAKIGIQYNGIDQDIVLSWLMKEFNTLKTRVRELEIRAEMSGGKDHDDDSD